MIKRHYIQTKSIKSINFKKANRKINYRNLNLKNMKKIFLSIISFLIFLSCQNHKKVPLDQGIEYWNFDGGETKRTPRHKYKSYTQGEDTIIYISNYYTNGNLKSKVIFKNDGIWEILVVLDTLGKPKEFGKLKKGNGYVTSYTNDTGIPEYKGKYVNGNKEGWWKHYHFKGYIIDSIFYEKGYDKSTKQGNTALDILIGPPDMYKNNLYE